MADIPSFSTVIIMDRSKVGCGRTDGINFDSLRQKHAQKHAQKAPLPLAPMQRAPIRICHFPNLPSPGRDEREKEEEEVMMTSSKILDDLEPEAFAGLAGGANNVSLFPSDSRE